MGVGGSKRWHVSSAPLRIIRGHIEFKRSAGRPVVLSWRSLVMMFFYMSPGIWTLRKPMLLKPGREEASATAEQPADGAIRVGGRTALLADAHWAFLGL